MRFDSRLIRLARKFLRVMLECYMKSDERGRLWMVNCGLKFRRYDKMRISMENNGRIETAREDALRCVYLNLLSIPRNYARRC